MRNDVDFESFYDLCFYLVEDGFHHSDACVIDQDSWCTVSATDLGYNVSNLIRFGDISVVVDSI